MDANENDTVLENHYDVKVTLHTGKSPKDSKSNGTTKSNGTLKSLNKTNVIGVLCEDDYREPEKEEFVLEEVDYTKAPVKISWINVAAAVSIHLIGLYGLNEVLRGRVALWQGLIVLAYGVFTNFGIAGGAHRLWAHRSYKARRPLELFLIFLQTLALQNSLYIWVRDHRAHHKFTETHADPHNAKRGFFFAHMGWLLCKKHPDTKKKGKTIDMTDLERDPVIMWQFRNYEWLAAIAFFIVPSVFFHYTCGWSYPYAFAVGGCLRYLGTLHLTWLINSAAHLIGPKPYDKDVFATESLGMKILGLGEGFHNYHHVFPWDYKAAEWKGVYFNTTKGFIDIMAILGLAYDLKVVPDDVVQRRVIKKGDGTHPVWGWGDKNIPKEHIDATQVIYKKTE